MVQLTDSSGLNFQLIQVKYVPWEKNNEDWRLYLKLEISHFKYFVTVTFINFGSGLKIFPISDDW